MRVSTFGESHGAAVGCIIDGLPAGMPVDREAIQAELDRRKPGQNKLTTQRKESDSVEILSGVFQGAATGTPIGLLVRNGDQRSGDYSEMERLYRPSHADLAYDLKYGFRDHRGGGRSSARETIGRVAAGSLAKSLLEMTCGTRIIAWVERIETIEAQIAQPERVTLEQVEASLVRCPDPAASVLMEEAVHRARGDGDSVGGVIRLLVIDPPVGAGEPVFDRVEAELAKAMLSIPACKGFEIGSGFAGTKLRGSAHNDPYRSEAGHPDEATIPTGLEGVGMTKNSSGGVQGGICVGAPIDCRIAFKPTATISSPQATVDRDGQDATLAAKGRHDPCVLPRAVPIVESMAALVLADLFLVHRSRADLFAPPSEDTP